MAGSFCSFLSLALTALVLIVNGMALGLALQGARRRILGAPLETLGAAVAKVVRGRKMLRDSPQAT